MHRRDQRPLRHHRAPAQLGTRSCAQKKTIAPSPASAATNAIEAYESLRAAVLEAEPVAGRDLITIRHHGLAGWIRGLARQSTAELPVPRARPKAYSITDPRSTRPELVRLLAGIVVSLVKDPAHA